MSRLLPLFDDGPPDGWTTKTAAAEAAKTRRRPRHAPGVFSWKVRLYMNDGTLRFCNLGRLTYAEAAKQRDDLMQVSDAYKAWLDRGLP